MSQVEIIDKTFCYGLKLFYRPDRATHEGGGLLTTLTHLGTAPSTAPDQVSPRPSKGVVIDAICQETGCSRTKAESFINWLENFVAWSRSNNYRAHYLTAAELRTRHEILDIIASDGAVAQLGSAHALVEGYVLDPARGELGMLHETWPMSLAHHATAPSRCGCASSADHADVRRSGSYQTAAPAHRPPPQLLDY